MKLEAGEAEALKPVGFVEPKIQKFFSKIKCFIFSLYDIYSYSSAVLSCQKYAHTSKQQLENISLNGKPGWISVSAS